MTDPRELAQRQRARDVVKRYYEAKGIGSKASDYTDEEMDNEGAKCSDVDLTEWLLAAEMPRWVPVEEKLPDSNRSVMCAFAPTNELGFLIHVTDQYDKDDGGWARGDLIKFWQELPALPRKKIG